jgi:hypothetical protein
LGFIIDLTDYSKIFERTELENEEAGEDAGIRIQHSHILSKKVIYD